MMTERVYDLHPLWPKRPIKDIPGLPPLPASNSDWLPWREAVEAHRVQMHSELRVQWHGRPHAIEREVARCKADIRYLCNVYFGIYESRLDEDDGDDNWAEAPPGFLAPFILYPFQDYLWDWMFERLKTKGRLGDGVVVKARDMGATNLACALVAGLWLTLPKFQARLLSRKEDMVDDKFSTDSMFWKIEHFLKSTPPEIIQHFASGFYWPTHRNESKITNPANANAMTGESTNATAGRGSRCTLMILDEFAFMRNPKGIWTATRPATRHRIGITSVSTDNGMFVHDLIEGGKDFPDERRPAVLRLFNELHPFHDEAWTKAERERDSEAGFRQEVLMDWFGDTSNFVYPMAGKKQTGPYPYLPHQGQLYCTIDDGFDNHWAMHWLQYLPDTGRIRVVESYKNRGQVADFYGSLMTGVYDSRFQYGPAEHRLMAFTRSIPQPIYVGDSHGAHREQVAGTSVYEHLATHWNIYVNIDYDRRQQKDRIEHLGNLIPLMDFNQTDGVEDALHSLKTYRWKRLRDGAEMTSEYKVPAHTEESHGATAFEFWATNFETFKATIVGAGIVYYTEDEYAAVESGNSALSVAY